jgi:hypothetical protein
MSSRRRMLYALVVILIMLDTLRRMFAGTRPIDWVMLVVEILVLAIIAAEAIHGILRFVHVRNIRRKLIGFIIEGQDLQATAPHGRIVVGDSSVVQWIKAATAWTTSVTVFLQAKCSRQAVATFLYYHSESSPTGQVAGSPDTVFTNVSVRLKNLREIIQNPEVYF